MNVMTKFTVCMPDAIKAARIFYRAHRGSGMSKVRYGLSAILVTAATLASSAQWQPPTDAVPAYFETLPAKLDRSRPILHGNQLTGQYFTHTYQVGTYKNAAKVADRLFLMPCYCRCDRAEGHKSLHSCFEGTHGAVCATCMREATYVYLKTQEGWSVAQIRAGIEKGEAERLDLKKIYPEASAH